MIHNKLVSCLKGSTRISTICSTRVYPRLPQMPTYPAVTYQRIGGVTLTCLSGSVDLKNPTFQLDAWAETLKEANDLQDRIHKTLNESTYFKAVRNAEPMDLFEDGLGSSGVWHVIADYSIWGKD